MKPPQINRLRIGRKICNKFCFTLYEAEDLSRKSNVSLKLLNPDIAKNSLLRNRFLTAAEFGKFLDSPSIPKIDKYGIENEHVFVISEYISAKPLSLFLHEQSPLNFMKVIDIVITVAKILRYAHLKGIVHGLLNPGTIYINDSGTIQIDDFGYDWLIPNLKLIAETEALYLSYYIPQEIFLGKEEIDGRIDVYALGVIFLQLLSDEFIFNGNGHLTLKFHNLNSKIPAVVKHFPESEQLSNILKTALNLNIEKRYQNFKDFIDDLNQLKDSLPAKIDTSNVTRQKFPSF